jgi:hypothetical protein
VGSRASPDHDRAEHPPVRVSGVEQDTYSVVLEVPKPECHTLDALDQIVEGLGGTVRDSRDVEVADLLEPGLDGPS